MAKGGTQMTSKTEKPPTPDPVELARQRVAELNSQEVKFAKQSLTAFADLSDLRSKRGRAVLEGAVPSEINREIRELEDSIETSAEAAAAARALRLVALDALRNAEADELDRQKTQLERDAAANKAAADEKRRELEAIAGCGYVSEDELAYARRGQLGGAPGNVAVMTVKIPIFKQLLNEAALRHQRAVQVRLQEPHRAGSIDADSLEQLVGLVFADPTRIGPTIEAITAWFDGAVANELRRRQRIDHGADFVPVHAAINKLRLTWKNGAIEVSSSAVSSASPSTPDVQAHAPGNVLFESSTGATVQAIDTDAEFARAAATEQSA